MKLTELTIAQIESVAADKSRDIASKVRGILCAIDFNDKTVTDGLLDQHQDFLVQEFMRGYAKGKGEA